MKLAKPTFSTPPRLWLSLLLLLCGSAIALAQSQISGTITDADTGDPLIGASVVIENTTTGVVTDLDGNFSLTAAPTDRIRVSYTGYQTQFFDVGSRQVFTIALPSDAETLGEVVVIGYGTVKKSDNTGAVSSLDPSNFNQGAAVSPQQVMQGRISGVRVTQTSGQPGSRADVRIRGSNSVSFGNSPLYVIDGVPIDFAEGSFGGAERTSRAANNPLNMINPADIERIDVLKDASATAIYGARAANGVVIVTTKQAGKGENGRVEYDMFVGSSSLRKKLPILSAAQVRDFAANNPELEFMDAGADTDWQDEIFRNAFQQSHSLSFTGGTGVTNYRASLGYQDQEGIIISSGNQVLTGRLNINSKLMNDRLTINMNLLTARENADNIPTVSGIGGDGGGDVIRDALRANPTSPVRSEDSPFSGGYTFINRFVQNPVEQAELVEDFTKSNRTIGNAKATYSLMEGLSFSTNVGFTQENIEKKSYFPLASRIGFERNGLGQFQTRDNANRLIETTLDYNTKVGGSDLKLLAGYSWQEFVNSGSFISRTGYVEDVSGADGIGAGGVVNAASTGKSDNRIISFFGRANFNVSDKYLITATVRRDGSSRFGADNKWGIFPSAALGWKISSEDFLAESSFIDVLKLRVGYGVTGNQAVPNYGSLALVNTGVNLNPELGVIASPSTAANPNLKWESTAQANIGLDYGILGGRIRGSFELYQKRTTDLILRFGVPNPTAISTRLENVGEVKNTGYEFDVTADLITKPNFGLEVFGNISANRNEVVSLSEGNLITPAFGIATFTAPSPQQQSQILITRVGESLGTLFGYEFTGFDRNGGEQFRDQNGDGILNGEDRVIIGLSQPDFTYGFGINMNFKRLTLSAFARGVQGVDILNSLRNDLENTRTLPNINALDAVLTSGASLPPSGQVSSRFVEDASFLRLENLTLNYDFNVSGIKAFNRLSAYVTGQNLLVLTEYTGFDPEHNVADFTTYPRPRVFLFGLRIGL